MNKHFRSEHQHDDIAVHCDRIGFHKEHQQELSIHGMIYGRTIKSRSEISPILPQSEKILHRLYQRNEYASDIRRTLPVPIGL